jgi:hypothetical protein
VRRRARPALAVVLALAAAAPAAAQVPRRIDDGPNLTPGAVESETVKDNVRVVISADRAQVPIVDTVTVTLAIEAPPWMLAAFPRLVDELGPFQLVREEAAGPFVVPGEGTRIQRNEHRYVLDPKVPGEHSIPPLTISVVDASKAPSIACVYLRECKTELGRTGRLEATNRPSFLRTGRLAIEVTSVLPADADITKPKTILPPVDLPPPPPTEIPWRQIAAALAASAALMLLGGWLIRRFRRGPRARAVPTRPAHELALAALRGLEGADAGTPERIEAFYVRLSAILRRYLDWRFGLHAPERTTEETLRAAAEAIGALAQRRDLVGDFLRACDRVKFARQRPGHGEARDMLGTAVRFVEETADASARVPVAQGGEAP